MSRSAKVHHVRPSAEPLFFSVAAVCGARAVAVVLTGGGVDGSLGVQEVKRKHGRVVAQDEASSEGPGMPQAACATGCVDLVLPLKEIAAALVGLVNEPALPPVW